MQILPLGIDNSPKKLKQAGFTLVEVLMSLLIIGLMTGLVVLNMPETEDPIDEQARLLAYRLETAAQTSMISNQTIGIQFTKDGYEAVRFVGDEWETIEKFEFDMETAPVVELVQNGAKIDLEKARKSKIPVIRFDATGMATPFELKVDIYGDELKITGSSDGAIQVGEEEDL